MHHRQHYLFFAWLIALSAFGITLYASEILHYPICTLCWYQRIAIYPLVILLGIGAYQDDSRCAIYGLPLAILGMLFSTYQYLIQMFPNWGPIEFCRIHNSCSTIHLEIFGFITFPFLSLLACTGITLLLWLTRKS